MAVITVIGMGYVGLVSAACLAEIGHKVKCLDVDAARIDLLQAGQAPIREPGLDALLRRNQRAGRLDFTCDPAFAAVRSRVQMICVDTPADARGGADLSHVMDVARTIARHMQGPTLVVNKSTVPVGTAERVRMVIKDELARRGADIDFDVASNPEFLQEGTAVTDFMRPDRIVIGADTPHAAALLGDIYAPLARADCVILDMDIRSAELAKYACNAMLATRVSFMNEMAGLAEKLDVDIEQVRRCMAADARIGAKFLRAGAGYGGACLPKDVSALIELGRGHGAVLPIAAAVQSINDDQAGRLVEKLRAALGADLRNRRIAIWGLTFKPDTDDLRSAPALRLACGLADAGARLHAYDPAVDPASPPAAIRTLRLGAGGLTLHADMYDALADADALVLMTEWQIFRCPDWSRMRAAMRHPVIIDARNLYVPDEVAHAGFRHAGVGLPVRAARSAGPLETRIAAAVPLASALPMEGAP